jgi:hypothetical protein
MQYPFEEVRVVQSDFDNDQQKFNPAQMSNLTSQNSYTESAIEEICPIHNDVIVAYNKKTKNLACNQCIYLEDGTGEGIPENTLDNMNFTSYVASELKDLFDEKFSLYKNQLS